ncbi:hypothetical protein B0675_08735 [Streptomyces sp. M41(2017)]|nr:hypothetical protein B0675_08735 [Streptomyces sp. M41(2017)]
MAAVGADWRRMAAARGATVWPEPEPEPELELGLGLRFGLGRRWIRVRIRVQGVRRVTRASR